MKLPENLRSEFKKPLGKLLHNNDITKERIIHEIFDASNIDNNWDNILLITIGDATTEKITSYGITPSIHIIDGLEKRRKRNLLPQSKKIKNVLYCNNPAGQISEQSIITIKKAFESEKPVRIVVDGEEDLLVLPVCVQAPISSHTNKQKTVILYGQPNEGMVIIHLDTKIKNKIRSLLELMKRV